MDQLIPPSIDPYELEVELVSWAITHFPQAAAAIKRNPEDRQWRFRCLASIVRKRGNADLDWFVRAVRTRPSHMLALAPWLGRIGGYPPEDASPQGWRQWIDDMVTLEGVA